MEQGAIGKLGEIVREVAPAHRYAVISDTNVAPLYGSAALAALSAAADLIVFPAGENSKTRDTWSRLTDELAIRGFGRDTTVVALGGGVVGDMAGFVASTYMRGVPVVQVPTTLLAMVDASIGGKTGVDTAQGKNLVGSFHNPAAVVADVQTLETLALEHLQAGFVEALKHGVIADEGYFEGVAETAAAAVRGAVTGGDDLRALVVRSIEVKAEIVGADERETGLRKVLNFGHTVGHAIELASGYSVSHGKAVAIGMVAESRIAERVGVAEPGTARRIGEALAQAGMADWLPEGFSGDALLAAMVGDKKARRGKVEYALPERVGRMAGRESGWSVAVDVDVIQEVLK